MSLHGGVFTFCCKRGGAGLMLSTGTHLLKIAVRLFGNIIHALLCIKACINADLSVHAGGGGGDGLESICAPTAESCVI